MSRYVLVFLGGGIGASARLFVGTMVGRLYATSFPAGTFLINITGSFLIGVLMTVFLNRPAVSANWRLFLVTGILGGYTTFSSFEWEALVNFRTGAQAMALLYIGGSVVIGLAAAWAGVAAGNRLFQ